MKARQRRQERPAVRLNRIAAHVAVLLVPFLGACAVVSALSGRPGVAMAAIGTMAMLSPVLSLCARREWVGLRRELTALAGTVDSVGARVGGLRTAIDGVGQTSRRCLAALESERLAAEDRQRELLTARFVGGADARPASVDAGTTRDGDAGRGGGLPTLVSQPTQR